MFYTSFKVHVEPSWHIFGEGFVICSFVIKNLNALHFIIDIGIINAHMTILILMCDIKSFILYIYISRYSTLRTICNQVFVLQAYERT